MLIRSTIAATALLLAAGCGGSDDAPADGATEPATTSTSAGPADTFCDDLDAAGATGASFGPIPVYDTGAIEDIVTQDAKLADVTPPEAIAADWATRKAFVADIDAWVVAGGPATGGPPDSTDSDAASQKITDYWFDTCS